MRLEMADFPVRELRLGHSTSYDKGVLAVAKEQVLKHVLEDPRITAADLELASPGESTRINCVCDGLEPRIKAKGTGTVFPGILGPVDIVGSGTTNRLSDMAVLACADVPTKAQTGTGAFRGGYLDMSGPGARRPFSFTHNLVVTLELAQGLTDLDYHWAIQMAEMKVGQLVAQSTLAQRPETVEEFQLAPVDPSLPRVILIQGVTTVAHLPHPGITYYGHPVRDIPATWIHPNEFFDGVIAGRIVGASGITWHWSNYPLIKGLYREHGVRFNFLGVLLERIRFETMDGKQIAANHCAKLAKGMGAEAAVITWMGGGNAFMDVMLTIQACEKLGIRTVLMTNEGGGDRGEDPPLLFMVPEADAIVSTGTTSSNVALPAVERVVGPQQIRLDAYPGAPRIAARGPIEAGGSRGGLFGTADRWGSEKDLCEAY